MVAFQVIMIVVGSIMLLISFIEYGQRTRNYSGFLKFNPDEAKMTQNEQLISILGLILFIVGLAWANYEYWTQWRR